MGFVTFRSYTTRSQFTYHPFWDGGRGGMKCGFTTHKESGVQWYQLWRGGFKFEVYSHMRFSNSLNLNLQNFGEKRIRACLHFSFEEGVLLLSPKATKSAKQCNGLGTPRGKPSNTYEGCWRKNGKHSSCHNRCRSQWYAIVRWLYKQAPGKVK